MINVKVTTGSGRSTEWNFPDGSVVGDVLKDKNLQTILGFGEKSAVSCYGTIQAANLPLRRGMELVISPESTEKQ